ncbi:unnamed protein product [Vitrella brassicaformis CCMP3155]|uniref:Uncharacterized protein n=2 Tax=Vitrella brassicaformis TaxID=1169539 RepID=A0A0G4FQQ1_VITBC|nr:unnamed protein product [Vitrella brassicaformis CCMP3155]|eukprot:CEM16401.1 unnamed protein product [Vitrella brassicaformis CCMP3155]
MAFSRALVVALCLIFVTSVTPVAGHATGRLPECSIDFAFYTLKVQLGGDKSRGRLGVIPSPKGPKTEVVAEDYAYGHEAGAFKCLKGQVCVINEIRLPAKGHGRGDCKGAKDAEDQLCSGAGVTTSVDNIPFCTAAEGIKFTGREKNFFKYGYSFGAFTVTITTKTGDFFRCRGFNRKKLIYPGDSKWVFSEEEAQKMTDWVFQHVTGKSRFEERQPGDVSTDAAEQTDQGTDQGADKGTDQGADQGEEGGLLALPWRKEWHDEQEQPKTQ